MLRTSGFENDVTFVYIMAGMTRNNQRAKRAYAQSDSTRGRRI